MKIPRFQCSHGNQLIDTVNNACNRRYYIFVFNVRAMSASQGNVYSNWARHPLTTQLITHRKTEDEEAMDSPGDVILSSCVFIVSCSCPLLCVCVRGWGQEVATLNRTEASLLIQLRELCGPNRKVLIGLANGVHLYLRPSLYVWQHDSFVWWQRGRSRTGGKVYVCSSLHTIRQPNRTHRW